MSFSVNYLVFCVPTLHINNYRNRDIVLNTLIAEFITLCVKHHMTGKVPKSKDFYKVSLCSNTIVSTWLVWGLPSGLRRLYSPARFPVRRSSANSMELSETERSGK